MSKLSLLQAFAAGREEVPAYKSSALLSLKTRKGRDCWYDWDEKRWVYIPASDPMGEARPLPADYKPVLGAACFLGAVGVAMGVDLAELAESDSYYAHPDFFANEDDRWTYPNGFVYSGGSPDAALKEAEFPCTGHKGNAGSPPDGRYLSGRKPIPEVVAHLNDAHDPRYTPARGIENPQKTDPWPEERIVEWLRSLGYNGDH